MNAKQARRQLRRRQQHVKEQNAKRLAGVQKTPKRKQPRKPKG